MLKHRERKGGQTTTQPTQEKKMLSDSLQEKEKKLHILFP